MDPATVRLVERIFAERQSVIPPSAFLQLLDAIGVSTRSSLIMQLTMNPSRITRMCGIDSQTLSLLLQSVSSTVVGPSSLLDRSREERTTAPDRMVNEIILQDARLDPLIRPLFVPGNLVEVAGESASGKTQFAIQMAVEVALSLPVLYPESSTPTPNPESLNHNHVWYINTEGDFPIRRLTQMVDERRKLQRMMESADSRTPSNNWNFEGWDQRIIIEHVNTLPDLIRLIVVRSPQLLSRFKVRLIVVDSIAAVVRSEFGKSEYATRAAQFFELSAILRRLADQSRLSVLLVNQVTDIVMDSDGNSDTNSRLISPEDTSIRSRIPFQLFSALSIPITIRCQPALGLSWTFCTHARVFLILNRQHSSDPEVDGNDMTTTSTATSSSTTIAQLTTAVDSTSAIPSTPQQQQQQLSSRRFMLVLHAPSFSGRSADPVLNGNLSAAPSSLLPVEYCISETGIHSV